MKQLSRPKSLTVRAIEGLREAIVTGQFKLGEPLSENQLASTMGISKTPVREALAQLRIEGLVRIVPQSGTFVFTLSSTEVVKMCELRSILEMAAFDLAYQRNREKFVEALKVIVDEMEKAHQAGDIPKYLHLDTEFHEQFFYDCDNQYLADAYRLIGGKIAALRTHLSSLPQHTDLSLAEHRQFADAIDHRQLEDAKVILDKHIGRSSETYADNVEDISMTNKTVYRK